MVNNMVTRISALIAVTLLAGCTIMPTGPSVLVLPGTAKDMKQFNTDEATCRDYANQRVNPTREERLTSMEAQDRYDTGYVQCMYGKGHRVPIPGEVNYGARDQVQPPPPNLPAPAAPKNGTTAK